MENTVTAGELSALSQLSTDIETAVERGSHNTVTVYGRRRLPATGIVWSSEGWIVTANHVVERDDDVTIGLPSGERLPVSVHGRDLQSDIALLVPETTGALSALQAHHSERQPRPGAIVLALGRPDDSGIMASFGTISANVRLSSDNDGDSVASALRANVAMLPGFSGGPLIDSEGGLIGMNSSHLSGGLTLTTPFMSEVVSSLAEHGRVRKGYLGIGAQRVRLSEAIATAGDGQPQNHGLLIVAVEHGGPAERDGLLLGDVILLVEETPVDDVESLQLLLSGDRVGTTVNLTMLRAGKVERRPVTVGERN